MASSPQTPSVRDTALVALDAGLSVVPPREDGTKAPVRPWDGYREQFPSKMTDAAADQSQAVDIARELAADGIPIFLSEPAMEGGQWNPTGGSGRTGYRLPKGYQKVKADPAVLDRWRPGVAVCAVAGHGLDLVDIDPRNGGHIDAVIEKIGEKPTYYGRASTPSDGEHYFVASLGVGSRNDVLPGVDVKAGVDGKGHGFAFIAPTVRQSKTTGDLVAYCWTQVPDLAALRAASRTNAKLAALVEEGRNGPLSASTGDAFVASATWPPSPLTDIEEVIANNTRHNAVVKLAGALRGRGGWRVDDAVTFLLSVVYPKLDQSSGGHQYSVEEFKTDVRDVFDRYPDGPNAPARVLHDTTLADGFRPTDVGNADRLAAAADGLIRFVHAWGKWIVYTDGRWMVDTHDTMITECAKQVAVSMFQRAVELDSNGDRDAMLKWAKSSESARSIAALIRLARGVDGILVDHRDLDADPWSLNVLNGTVDLRTGQLREHDPSDLLTMQAPVTYDRAAPASLWTACVEMWQPDSEQRAYLQRAVGSGLTGHPLEHFFVNLGGGANGKGKFFGAIDRILGPYYVVPHKSLLVTQRHDQHDTVKAKLFRSRMVVGAETEDGDRLDEAKIKDLTGGDPLEARRMREDPWPFMPSWTMFLHTNYRPRIRGTDEGIWRRVRLIEWPATIPSDQRDPHLAEKLSMETSGILNWLIAGCLAWQDRDLDEPDTVVKATARWRSEEDVIGRWLDDCTAQGTSQSATLAALRASLEAWCADNGEKAVSAKALGSELAKRGFVRTRAGKRKATTYTGVGLLAGASIVARKSST